MGLYEQVDYDFSDPLQPQDLFGREYVTMGFFLFWVVTV